MTPSSRGREHARLGLVDVARLLAPLCLVLGCRQQAQGAAPAEPFTGFHWKTGTAYSYSTELVTHAKVPATTAGQFDVTFTGRLDVLPLKATGTDAELELTLSEIHAGNERDPDGLKELANELGAPARVSLKAGRIERARFSEGTSARGVGFWRTLMAALQATAPPAAGGSSWPGHEYDSTGLYEARYELAPGGDISKRKVKYEGLLAVGALDDHMRQGLAPRIVLSSGLIHVDDGVPTHVTESDAFQTELLQGTRLDVTTSVELKLAARSSAPSRRPSLVEAQSFELASDRAFGPRPSQERFDSIRISGETFEGVVAKLQREVEQERQNARSKSGKKSEPADQDPAELHDKLKSFSVLVALLRAQPESLRRAEDLIRHGTPIANKLTDAMAAAGTAPAQAALVSLMKDVGIDRDLRIGVAMSLIRVQSPTKDTVAFLEGLVRDPLFADHAVFGLGTAARRLREAGLASDADSIGRELEGLVSHPRDQAEQVRALRGIANSGDARLVSALRPLLSNVESEVRSAAVEAMRLMPASEEVDGLTAQRAEEDTDFSVRLAAIRSMTLRSPSEKLATALEHVATKDENAVVRQRAVEGLVRWQASIPHVRETLRQVAATDSRDNIREAAQAALGG